MSEQNKALARRFYDDVVNGGQFDLIDELIGPDFVEHEAFPGLSADREGVRKFFEMCRTAFDNFRMDIQDIIAENDKVVIRLTMSGTQRAEFAGVQSRGNSFTVPVIDIVRVANGKVVEHWGATDGASMMEQLTG